MPNVEPSQVDYTLFSDGSGHQDGYSGWMAIVLNHQDYNVHRAVGALSQSSVDRSEFTALLEGLELIHSGKAGKARCLPCISKPRVRWYSDRESLVGSVAEKWGQGKGRHAQKDLWRRFEYYEGKFSIIPIHVARETEYPLFQEADLHASSMRILIKSYVEDIFP